MKIDPLKNQRILVIDDNRAIHDDFRKILLKPTSAPNDLADDEEARDDEAEEPAVIAAE